MKLRDVNGMRCLYRDDIADSCITCVATDGYIGVAGHYSCPPEVGGIGGKFGDRIKRLLGRSGSSRQAARGYAKGALTLAARSGLLPLGTSAAALAIARQIPVDDSQVVVMDEPETEDDAVDLLERAEDALEVAGPIESRRVGEPNLFAALGDQARESVVSNVVVGALLIGGIALATKSLKRKRR